jgi:cholesterol oxidase
MSDTLDQAATVPATLGVTFTEVMAGFVAAGAGDFAQGAHEGRQSDTRFAFRGTATFPDLDAFLADTEHRGILTGTASGSFLPSGEAPFEGGEIALFAPVPGGRMAMRYRFAFEDAGQRFEVSGFKDVYNDRIIDAWTDTTRLFTTVRRTDATPSADPGEWRGVLVLSPASLVPQVLSFRGVGVRRPWDHPRAVGRFLWFFTSKVLGEYRPRLRR